MTKVIILAAGIGSRLHEITDKNPKCLVKVGSIGKSILDSQIEAYTQAGINECDICVVIGYKAEQIIDFLKEKYPKVKYHVNTKYIETNNMFSLYSYLKDLKYSNIKHLFISNGDCVYSKDIIRNFYDFCNSNNQCSVVCDSSRYDSESMKVIVKNNRVIKISKEISEKEYSAISTDLYHINTLGIELFLKSIYEYIEKKGERNLWTEVALQSIFPYISFLPFYISQNSKWIEIDTQEDLINAHRLFSNFNIDEKKVGICDLDGTLFVGQTPIQKAIDFIIKYQNKIRFYFLTNNTSKTPDDYLDRLNNVGIIATESQILTPLNPLIDFINSQNFNNICLIANSKVTEYIKKRLKKPEIINRGPEYDASVLTYDTEITYEKIKHISTSLNQTHLLIATHSDKMCPSENGPIPDIGSFIAMLRSALGYFKTTTFGKPNLTIINTILSHIDKNECFIVGDRLYTDYLLAKKTQIDFLCVLSGETKLIDIQKLKSFRRITILPLLSDQYLLQ